MKAIEQPDAPPVTELQPIPKALRVGYEQRVKHLSERERVPFDFYPTPIEFAEAALKVIPEIKKQRFILDPGAGTGVWGEAMVKLNPAACVDGVEMRDVPKPADYLCWYPNTNFLEWEPVYLNEYAHFDMVIGNPPYNQAEAFIRASMALLREGGWMVLLLRGAFRESIKRGRGLWQTHCPAAILDYSQRPSFTGDGKTDATAYAAYIWQNTEAVRTRGWYYGGWIDVENQGEHPVTQLIAPVNTKDFNTAAKQLARRMKGHK